MIDKLISDQKLLLVIDAIESFDGCIRLVGGCVRDSIIGRETTDIDLATNLTPEVVLEALRAVKIKAIPTGISHGTVTAVVGKTPYEITTLRADTQCDGRHALVAFTDSWLDDASRRDFTFNAMYCDKHGRIYDYFSGIRDLLNRKVAFIGNAEERINEDFLRILRVFRFHASICSDSVLDPEIVSVCQKYAKNLSRLSRERIRNEFLKLLACDNCSKTLQVMQGCGVLSQIMPYNLCMDGLPSTHIALRSPITKLALMLKSGSLSVSVAELTKEVTDLLRLSRKEKKTLSLLLSTDIEFPITQTQQHKYLNMLDVETYKDLLIVNFLQNATAPESTLLEHLAYADAFVHTKMPISGKDLVDLGYEEGKFLGQTLKTLRTIWEENPHETTREHLINLARALIKRARASD